MGIDYNKMGMLGSLLLMVMVMGVTVKADTIKTTTNVGILGKSNIAILCGSTDYKQSCEKSLASANTSDFNELIGLAFQAAEENIGKALKNSTLLQKAAKDPRTKGAFKVCEEVLDSSISDIRRSFRKLQKAKGSKKMGAYVTDLKTWISGALTYQETCIDAFENTTGDNGAKMKVFLKSANELTSNGLAMVSSLTKIINTLNLGNFGFSRRLFSDDEFDPAFVDSKARRLMQAAPEALKPNAVVAQDGSSQFKTIGDAVNSIPTTQNNQPFVIYVKAGVYKEYITIPKKANNVVLVGDGPLKTIITGNKNYADGVATFHSSTLTVEGEDFMAKDIAIENTAGAEKHQAVAVRVSGDKSVFYNVHMNGFQDTLYAHNYRQFYRDCLISGTIDFIFGDARSVFQNCTLVVRKPMQNQACMVTAQGRKEKRGQGAIIIQNCKITAENDFLQAKPALEAYLGRPWKEYSQTIIMRTDIGGFISPLGWSPWMGTFALDTLYYAEFENTGPGSKNDSRVAWKGIQHITPAIAETYTPGVLYEGDEWIKSANIPYNPGMF